VTTTNGSSELSLLVSRVPIQIATNVGSRPLRLSNQVAQAKEVAMASTPSGHKLRKAAAEFEAQLLSSLWKSMKSSFAPDDDSSDPGKQSLEEWSIDAMCSAVGKAGGLGIGKSIVRALESKNESRYSGVSE
jgi:Rod binding domain-containing protein